MGKIAVALLLALLCLVSYAATAAENAGAKNGQTDAQVTGGKDATGVLDAQKTGTEQSSATQSGLDSSLESAKENSWALVLPDGTKISGLKEGESATLVLSDGTKIEVEAGIQMALGEIPKGAMLVVTSADGKQTQTALPEGTKLEVENAAVEGAGGKETAVIGTKNEAAAGEGGEQALVVEEENLGGFENVNIGIMRGDAIYAGVRTYGADEASGFLQSQAINIGIGREGGLVGQQPVWVLPQTCNNNTMNALAALSFAALLATCTLVAVGYMFGKAIESPRVLNWCKIEVWQVFASALIVVAIYAVLSLFCVATPAQLGPVFGLGGGSYTSALARSFGDGTQGMYVATQSYLEKLASYSKGVMTAVRYNIGAYELRSGVQKYKCEVFCLLAGAGTSYAPYGGEASHISLLSNMLSIATIAFLSVLFQLFLLLYINNGLFLVFLPIAIVVRSLPFMRGFGGAMIALVLSLYIMYPFMIYVDGILVPQAAAQLAPVLNNRGVEPAIVPLLGAVNADGVGGENILEQNAYSEYDNRQRDDMPSLIMLVAFVFIAGVFAPALNFIVIAAVAREISRVFGEELDVSRLGQML